VKQANDLSAKAREEFGKLRDLSREDRQKKAEELSKANDKAVGEVLKPDQLKRLKQIHWQQQGARAFSDPELADALKFTTEQKDKIQAVREEARKEMQSLRQAGGDREEARKKFEEIRKATNEKVMGVLTDEQKAKWKELQGEPFKGEIVRPGAGARRGSRGPSGA
jgi:hypothetical protein